MRPTKSLLGLAKCFLSFLRHPCLHARSRTNGDRPLSTDVVESLAPCMVRDHVLEVLEVEAEAATSETV